MTAIIEIIKCQTTIILNWLPIYNIIFFTYLGIPVIIVTYYKNRETHIKHIYLAIILLVIWIAQTIIWSVAYDTYYAMSV